MSFYQQTPAPGSLFTSLCIALLLFYSVGCNKIEDKLTTPNNDSLNNGLSDAGSTASQRPNIIFVLGDDIGYEVPTYTGGQSYSTPNLDFIAANGTQFSQAHGSIICSPSRFMLMTGKYNFRNYFQWGELGLDQRTLGNLAKNAGYITCVSGKWQFDGGDAAIHNFGFDNYAVDEAFSSSSGSEEANDFYKNPTVYENGQYLPDSYTKGKYGPDIYRDYVFNFIDSNKSKPFFVYWATNLAHKPYCPTPDDPDYAAWVPGQKPKAHDTVYFKSMVKYMDKQIGQLITKLQQTNLDRKTLIIFAGDNGTPHDIYSMWNGKVIQGGKAQIEEKGYHLPLLAYLPSSVPGGRKDTSLIDFTDFIPTFADIFKTTVPASYGTIDGVSFYPQLQGLSNSKARSWVFCHYQLHPDDPNSNPPERWMENRTYKEYDTATGFFKSKKFYNIVMDADEKKPIQPASRTPQETTIYNNFKQNMSTLH